MPNKLLIKANFCDLRNVKEETLAAYDVIEVRANVVVLNDRAKELIARYPCLLYTSPSPRDRSLSRMPSSA